MKQWLKVWWHCLMKTLANMRGEDHRMCTIKFGPSTTYMCSCEYYSSQRNCNKESGK